MEKKQDSVNISMPNKARFSFVPPRKSGQPASMCEISEKQMRNQRAPYCAAPAFFIYWRPFRAGIAQLVEQRIRNA